MGKFTHIHLFRPGRRVNLHQFPAFTFGWQARWGIPPSINALTAARDWARMQRSHQFGLEGNPHLTGSEIAEANIDLRALCAVDQEVALHVLERSNGRHRRLAGEFTKGKASFRNEVCRALLTTGINDRQQAYRLYCVVSILSEIANFKPDDFARMVLDGNLAVPLLERFSQPGVIAQYLEWFRQGFDDYSPVLRIILVSARERQLHRPLWEALSPDAQEFYLDCLSEADEIARLVDIARRGAALPGWKAEWGDLPSDADIANARAFATAARVAYPDYAVPGLAYDAHEKEINLAALWLIDREIALAVFAYASGIHDDLITGMRSLESRGLLAEVTAGLVSMPGCGPARAIRSYLWAVFGSFEKAADFLNRYNLGFGLLKQYTTLRSELNLVAGGFLRFLDRHGRQQELFAQLTLEELRLLNELLPDSLSIDLPGSPAAASPEIGWQAEWGERPSPQAMAAASRWAQETRMSEDIMRPRTCESARQNKINLRALYLVDPDLLIIVLRQAHGCHSQVTIELGEHFFFACLASPLLLSGGINELARFMATFGILGPENELKVLRKYQLLRDYIIGACRADGCDAAYVLMIFITMEITAAEWNTLPDEAKQALRRLSPEMGEPEEQRTSPAIDWNPNWGEAPTPQAVEAVRRWAEQTRREARDGGDNWMNSPQLAEKAIRAGVDLFILLLVDTELAIWLIGSADGNHYEVGEGLGICSAAEEISTAQHARIIYLLGTLFFREEPAANNTEQIRRSILSIYHMFVAPVNPVEVAGRLLYESGLIQQLVDVFIASGIAEAAEMLGWIMIYLNQSNQALSFWATLKNEAREALVKADVVWCRIVNQQWEESLRKTTSPSVWQVEWGEAPSSQTMASAREFYAEFQPQLSEVNPTDVANEAVGRGLDFGALYLIDPVFALDMLACIQGRHDEALRGLMRHSPAFMALLIRGLLDPSPELLALGGEMPFYAAVALTMLTKIRFSGTWGDSVFSFCEVHDLEDLVLDRAQNRRVLAGMDPNWSTNVGHMVGFMLSSGRRSVSSRVAAPPTKVEQFVGEAVALAGDNRYIPEVVTLFLERFTLDERPDALQQLISQNRQLAGLIVRSAVGKHTEVTAVLNRLPSKTAAELIEAELALVSDTLLADQTALAEFRRLDNFGALKGCFELRPTEGGAGIVISPIWEALSPHGKAEFFRVFRLYCLTVREMFTEMLPLAFARKMRELPPAELAELSRVVPADVKEFLKVRHIVDLQADYDPSKFPLPSTTKACPWDPAFGQEPEELGVVIDFLARINEYAIEHWGEVPYSCQMQQAFTDACPFDELPAAFRALWCDEPTVAATIIRTVKFHEGARQMLSGLTPAHLAHLLDVAIVGLPAFNNRDGLELFDHYDSGALVRGLCLLPKERVAEALQQVQPMTLARVFDQIYAVTFLLTEKRRRTYLANLLTEILVEEGMLADHVAAALTACQAETALWIKQLYGGRLDLAATLSGAAAKHGSDPIIASLAEEPLTQARMIWLLNQGLALIPQLTAQWTKPVPQPDIAAAVTGLRQALSVSLGGQAVLRVGELWDLLHTAATLAQALHLDDYLAAREYLYLTRLAEQLAEYYALAVYAGEMTLPIRIARKDGVSFAGQTTAQLVIVDAADELTLQAHLTAVRPFQAVVSRRYPTRYSDTTDVPAMLTAHGGGEYDHDTMKALRQRAAGNNPLVGSHPGITRLLRPFDGQWVTIILSQLGSVLRLATPAEINQARASYNLLDVPDSSTESLAPKIVKLLDLKALEIPVPAFVPFSAELSAQFYERLGLAGRINIILGANQLVETVQKLARIRDLITQAPLPAEIAAIILAANGELPGEYRIFRPSANFEDRDDFAAAGYLDSPVSTNQESALIQAVLAGWASYWNYQPFMARVNHGLDHYAYLPSGALMHLIVGRAAGNMIVRPGEIEISAVPGQGQGAMSEGVPVDQYRLEGETIQYTPPASPRTFMMGLHDGRLQRIPLQAETANDRAISPQEARILARYGKFMLANFGPQPRDIEWVVDENGVWIVQDRAYLR